MPQWVHHCKELRNHCVMLFRFHWKACQWCRKPSILYKAGDAYVSTVDHSTLDCESTYTGVVLIACHDLCLLFRLRNILEMWKARSRCNVHKHSKHRRTRLYPPEWGVWLIRGGHHGHQGPNSWLKPALISPSASQSEGGCTKGLGSGRSTKETKKNKKKKQKCFKKHESEKSSF